MPLFSRAGHTVELLENRTLLSGLGQASAEVPTSEPSLAFAKPQIAEILPVPASLPTLTATVSEGDTRTKTQYFTDGSYQQINYTITENFTLTCQPYGKARDQVDYTITQMYGTLDFSFTATDSDQPGSSWTDNAQFNYGSSTSPLIPVGTTSLVYSTSLNQVIAFGFNLPTQPGDVTPTQLSYGYSTTDNCYETTAAITLPSQWQFDGLYHATHGTVYLPVPMVSGIVYTDTNDNGQKDPGEPGEPNVIVFADFSGTGAPTSIDPSTTTNVDGNYTLDLPWGGAWPILEVVPTSYTVTQPTGGVYNVTVTPGETLTGVNFGNWAAPPFALAFDQQPTDTMIDYQTGEGDFGDDITVDVLNDTGTLATSDDSFVTLSIAGPAGITLGGTQTVQAQDGVATFDDLSVEAAGVSGGDCTLTATDGGVSSPTSSAFTVTTLLDLANLNNNLYSATAPTAGTGGYTSIFSALDTNLNNAGYAAEAYINGEGTQVIIAFRGTYFGNSLAAFKNVAADISFGGTTPTSYLISEVGDAVQFLDEVHGFEPNATITLTGHSLGGAVAQLVGEASGASTYAFNAPGAGQLYNSLMTDSSGLSNVATGLGPGTDVNYRIYGDQFSLFGTPTGTSVTLEPGGTLFPNLGNPLEDVMAAAVTFYNLHLMPAVLSAITQNAPFDDVADPSGEPNFAVPIETYILPILSILINSNVEAQSFKLGVSLALALFDPDSGTDFVFAGQPGSPNLASVDLPTLSGVASYDVWYETGGVWSAPMVIPPGVQDVFGPNVDGVEFEPLDSSGQGVEIPGSFLFAVGFSSAGTFAGTLFEAASPTDLTTAAQLAFVQQPANTTAGALVSPAITVDVENALGDIVTGDNSTVTLGIASGPGYLSGTLTAQAENGVATFSNVSLLTGGSYTLSAIDGSLSSATSSSFSVAVSDTWTGGQSNLWSNPGNWSVGASPGSATSVVINGGSVVTTAPITIANLTVSGGTLRLPSGLGISTVSNLTIAGTGTLDLGNNELIINYGSNPDPKTAILSDLRSGYNGGSWTGPGIDSSVAALTKGAYGVGFADGADGVVQSLSNGQIELKYTLNGDANLDGLVNAADFTILAANFNQSVAGWDHGDFNYDGLVNAADFTDLAANFNQGVNLNAPGLVAGSAAIYTITGSPGAQMLDILSGTVTLTSDLSALLPNYSLQIENGASVILASDQHIGALQLVGSGSLDVRNYTMFINYGSNSDPITTIAGYIKSGYNGGGWNGPGIISTAARTKTNGLLYGLGYADSADKGNPAGLSSGQIEVKYTLLGDANLDGLVNAADFLILSVNFNEPVTGWDQGDFNYDGLVNAADFTDLAANFNQAASGASVASTAAVVAVPAAPTVATVSTQSTAAAAIAPKSKAVMAKGKPKAVVTTAYAASVVPSAGSGSTPQDFRNKDAKFLADR